MLNPKKKKSDEMKIYLMLFIIELKLKSNFLGNFQRKNCCINGLTLRFQTLTKLHHMWGRTCFCPAQLGICVYGWPPECPTRVTKRWKLMGWQMVLEETEKLPLSFTWPYAQCSGAKNHIFSTPSKRKKMNCLERQVFQSVGNGQGGKSFPLFYTNSGE